MNNTYNKGCSSFDLGGRSVVHPKMWYTGVGGVEKNIVDRGSVSKNVKKNVVGTHMMSISAR